MYTVLTTCALLYIIFYIIFNIFRGEAFSFLDVQVFNIFRGEAFSFLDVQSA